MCALILRVNSGFSRHTFNFFGAYALVFLLSSDNLAEQSPIEAHMLKRIRIRNFLSLKDIDLQLSGRNVLVGPNMSGKSNLMEAFKFIQEAASRQTTNNMTPLQQALSNRGGFGEVVWRGQSEGPIEFEIVAELAEAPAKELKSYDYQASIGLNREYGHPEVQSERLIVTSAGKSETILENTGGKLRMPASPGFGEGPQQTLNLALELTGRFPHSKGSSFWNFVENWRFYHLVPAIMRRSNPPSWESYLSEHGENLSVWLLTLQNHPEEFHKIEQACRDVLSGLAEILFQPVEPPKEPIAQGATSFSYSTESSKISVGVSETHFKKPTSINRMSDGELAFLGLMSLILAPADLSPPLLCIEEPENYLHPKLVEVLVELLNQRQRETGAPQVIATTHSPLLVDKLSIDDLIIVQKEQGATKFSRASSKKRLKKLLSRKEVSLGDLWYSGALAS
ncbi:MAG: AAA family ATPase [Candidatus Binatus sp.]